MTENITSCNTYITRDWIIIIPRKADKVFHGVSFNGLGMLGNVKIPEDRKDLVPIIRETTIEKILESMTYSLNDEDE